MRVGTGFLILFMLCLAGGAARSATIWVPDDFASIQDAINAAADHDTILVRPGTYVENINFNGKQVALESEQGPAVTTIGGGQAESVVTFESGEGPDAVLDGFTITNGNGIDWGGGVVCSTSSPTITNNIISDNTATHGGGIGCFASASIITNNIIKDNTATASDGGGIYCSSCASLIIEGNAIFANMAHQGGAICCTSSSPTIGNNTISENVATEGGGIYFRWYCYPTILNTILWDNSAAIGPELYLAGPPSLPTTLAISYSDVAGGASSTYVATGSTISWGAGMIDADPLFVDPAGGDYHLQAGSPCIDAGDPTSPLDPDGTAADMGAFYFDQNAPVFTLAVAPDPLIAGQNAVFDVTSGLPDETTYLVYSVTGPGSTWVPSLNVALDLAGPRRAAGPTLTDSGGGVTWNLTVPGAAAGRNVWFQAVQYRQVTNLVAATVQ